MYCLYIFTALHYHYRSTRIYSTLMLVSMNGSKTHVQFFSNRLIKFRTRKSISAWLALIVNVLFSSEPGNVQRHITIVAFFRLADTVAFCQHISRCASRNNPLHQTSSSLPPHRSISSSLLFAVAKVCCSSAPGNKQRQFTIVGFKHHRRYHPTRATPPRQTSSSLPPHNNNFSNTTTTRGGVKLNCFQ